jgi:hypothetical protein
VGEILVVIFIVNKMKAEAEDNQIDFRRQQIQVLSGEHRNSYVSLIVID